MFTFGREHEKKCVARYVRNKDHVPLACRAIDSVHDCLEGAIRPAQMCRVLSEAFTEGGSGVWENAGYWLRKAVELCPELVVESWTNLSNSPKAEIRWRVACFLHEIPLDAFNVAAPNLVADKSGKVRDMAEARVKQRSSKSEI